MTASMSGATAQPPRPVRLNAPPLHLAEVSIGSFPATVSADAEPGTILSARTLAHAEHGLAAFLARWEDSAEEEQHDRAERIEQ